MTTFTATTGVDTFQGTNADDTFIVTATDQIQFHDIYDGNGGSDTIQIGGTGNAGGTINFEAANTNKKNGFLSISDLMFENTLGTSTAKFSDGQFGNSKISTSALITGSSGTNSLVIDLLDPAATFSMASWSFAGWTDGTDTVTVNGSSGDDAITGSSQSDILNGGGGDDTITGNGGADTMTGGTGHDTFVLAAGNGQLVIGGSGTSGTISGFGRITDFSAGFTTATSENLRWQGAAVVGDTALTDGVDSTLQLHTGNVVGSHAITAGMISFNDSTGSAVSLTSLSDVAAAVEYLQGNDLGNAGSVVAFTATASGQPDTFVYFQGANGIGTTNVLVELDNVTATLVGTGQGNVRIANNTADLPDLTYDPLVDATEVTAVAFDMTGLVTGSTADLLFFDGDGHQVQATRTSNGSFTVDFSPLGDGTIGIQVTVTDSALNTASVQLLGGTFKDTDSSLDMTTKQYKSWTLDELTNYTNITLVGLTVNAIGDLDADEFAGLAPAGVDFITSQTGSFFLDVEDYLALGGVPLDPANAVTLFDFGGNIAGLGASDFAQFASTGIDVVRAEDKSLEVFADEFQAIAPTTTTFFGTDNVTLYDTGAAIAALSTTDLAQLKAKKVDAIDTSDNQLALSIDQYNATGLVKIAVDEALTVTGTTGDDEFVFRNGFNAGDEIIGNGGNDILKLVGGDTIAFTDTSLSGISRILMGAGSDHLTMADGNVADGATMYIHSTGSLTFDASAETNGRFNVYGSNTGNTFTGGTGADSFQGGTGVDNFQYTSVLQSTSTTYDTVVGFDAAADFFTTSQTVTGVDPAVTTGALSKATFNTDRASTLNSTTLLAQHAALFTPTAGNLAGSTFLVIDENNIAGYQANQDLVINLKNGTNLGSLSISNFH